VEGSHEKTKQHSEAWFGLAKNINQGAETLTKKYI
jgi:hypothetical protein